MYVHDHSSLSTTGQTTWPTRYLCVVVGPLPPCLLCVRYILPPPSSNCPLSSSNCPPPPRPPLPPAAAAMDTGAEADAASTEAGPRKGVSASCCDIICDHCNGRIWHDGQEKKQMRVMLSRHMNANGGRCRPDGTFKPAKEAKTLMEQMITNRNIFEVRGARGCDFLQRTDPPDAHQCSGCSKLFPTLDQANRHMQHTKCKQARPSSKATPVHCHITIGGTLVRALPSTRRRLDSAFAAVPATPAIRP